MQKPQRDPVLLIGGSGVVGNQAATTLRSLHPDQAITIGGRDLARAESVAASIPGASAARIDLDRRDLGLPQSARFSGIAIFVKDATLNALRYAQDHRLPHISISSGVAEIGPEVALFIHDPKAAPIVLGSTWLVGAAIYPVLEFAKAFKSIDRLDIAVVLDEQDMGGPAALADFERITRAGPMALFVTDGKWHWARPDDATRIVADSGGQETRADAYSPLDVMALANMTRAQSIRFGLVYGQSASRRRGEPFSTEIIFEIEGEMQGRARTRKRYELIHPKGQAPLTALGVSLALERLIGLDGRTPVGPGLYFAESLIDPAYAVERLKGIGTRIHEI
jgi:hypothetical protein